MHHIELCKNSVCKWVQDQTISIQHVPRKTNPADIATKEMHNGIHFHRLWDSFLSQLSDFLSTSLLEVHHVRQQSQNKVSCLATHVFNSFGASSYIMTLTSNTFCWLVTAISYILSADCHILSRSFGLVPSGLIWSLVMQDFLVAICWFLYYFASHLPKLFNLENPPCLAFLSDVPLDAWMGGVCLSVVP